MSETPSVPPPERRLPRRVKYTKAADITLPFELPPLHLPYYTTKMANGKSVPLMALGYTWSFDDFDEFVKERGLLDDLPGRGTSRVMFAQAELLDRLPESSSMRMEFVRRKNPATGIGGQAAMCFAVHTNKLERKLTVNVAKRELKLLHDMLGFELGELGPPKWYPLFKA